MSIRKGTSIIAGNLGQNIDDALSLTSTNPVQNKVITEELETKLGQSYITNCITKIPQDIKLELNGGALILKSGSKFYYPNGLDGTTPIFNSFTTTSDLTLSVGGTGWTNKEHAILVLNDGTSSAGYACPDDLYSGDNPPTLSTQYACWYDTGSNIIRRTTDSGSTWTSTPYSFPICIAVNTGGNCDSISQIFNGFGYVGSVVFLLPGVTGLFPNGKNEDGTLRNLKITSESVIIKNFTNLFSNPTLFDYVLRLTNHNGTWKLDLIEPAIDNTYTYNSEENYWYYYTTKSYYCPFARVLHDNPENDSKILSFSGKQTIKIIDSSDTEFIVHQVMPNGRYIQLTVGASGAEYTAPADGYVFVSTNSGHVHYTFFDTSSSSYYNAGGDWLPVKKGGKFKISYYQNPTAAWFMFAEGVQ